MLPFEPIVKNPHILTILANFATRRLDTNRFPVRERLYRTEPDAQVLVHEQRPTEPALAEIVMVHGLEGSSNAGYIRSMSQLALENGYAVHRKNMRSCGGTEALCKTMYHAGLTSDTLEVIRNIRRERKKPVYLIGYSLGGNVALKLAGELGESAAGLLDGVIAVSTPIDLAASVRKMSRRTNWIYESRFLSRLKERIRRRAESLPGVYDVQRLDECRSVYEFDDHITAPFFGFGSADNYYATQSSKQFLERIRIPTLLIQAKDDPLIPFDIYDDPAIRRNPHIRLVAAEHGGHLGFISKRAPRFWVDRVVLGWLTETRNKQAAHLVSST
ncbi:MAG TPA: alpha/beta fold hydrolase [Bryobacteraceae bacterium]|nr:alpha/beta fold hydrolase [Bryobacteraceae bacterium]